MDRRTMLANVAAGAAALVAARLPALPTTPAGFRRDFTPAVSPRLCAYLVRDDAAGSVRIRVTTDGDAPVMLTNARNAHALSGPPRGVAVPSGTEWTFRAPQFGDGVLYFAATLAGAAVDHDVVAISATNQTISQRVVVHV